MKTRSKEEIERDIQAATVGLRTKADIKNAHTILRRLYSELYAQAPTLNPPLLSAATSLNHAAD